MQITIKKAPVKINATIKLPSSKSISNRALIMNALGNGTYTPENISICDDTNVMVKALNDPNNPITDIMAAGTAMRFLTAYYSVLPNSEKIITGTERMKNRPISILVNALRYLGADIEYTDNEGYPPLKIRGKSLDKSDIEIQGNISSQYISAILMIGPMLPKGLNVKLTGNVISRPYIDLTINLMKEFGVDVRWSDVNYISIKPTTYKSVPFFIESDWSASSYWYQIAALADEAEIELPYLFNNSYQGDSKVADLFSLLGVSTSYDDKKITLRKDKIQVSSLKCNFVNQPDLAQTFVVTCSLLNIPFFFTGLQSLKIKETDRIKALITEMKKLGYIIKQKNDSILYWNGERCKANMQPIDTYEDHRMAMAFAPASILIKDIKINNPHVVTKSYPQYWEDLKKVGFIIE